MKISWPCECIWWSHYSTVQKCAEAFLNRVRPQKGVNLLLIRLTVKTDKASLSYHKA